MIKLINTYMTEADICEIARISTGKKSRADEELIRFLIEQQHDSIFEHAVMTFLVEVPIYTARQWQRHRIGSFTEKSGRYSEMAQANLNAPEIDTDEYYIALAKMDTMYEYYRRLLRAGAKKENARQVLPLATPTKFYWTVNLRSLMNFLSNRMDVHAQADILNNARAVYEAFKEKYPNIADAWAERTHALKHFLKEWRAKGERVL